MMALPPAAFVLTKESCLVTNSCGWPTVGHYCRHSGHSSINSSICITDSARRESTEGSVCVSMPLWKGSGREPLPGHQRIQDIQVSLPSHSLTRFPARMKNSTGLVCTSNTTEICWDHPKRLKPAGTLGFPCPKESEHCTSMEQMQRALTYRCLCVVLVQQALGL